MEKGKVIRILSEDSVRMNLTDGEEFITIQLNDRTNPEFKHIKTILKCCLLALDGDRQPIQEIVKGLSYGK